MSTVNIDTTTSTVTVTAAPASTVTVQSSPASTQVIKVITAGPKGDTGIGEQGPPGVLPTTGSFPFSGSINLTGSLFITGGQVLIDEIVLGSDKVGISTFNSFTSSYYSDSGSFDSRINNISFDSSSLVLTSSFNIFTSSIESRVLNLEQTTGSYVTTGSNTFIGNQTITGSFSIQGTGSLNGDNIVSSNTIQKIETITSASYAALTPPISGTLYIVIG